MSDVAVPDLDYLCPVFRNNKHFHGLVRDAIIEKLFDIWQPTYGDDLQRQLTTAKPVWNPLKYLR